MQWLKNILKHILPPPVTTFNREINGLKKQNAAAQSQIRELNKKIDRLNALVEQGNNQNKRILRETLELLDPKLYPHALKQWYQNRTGNILDLSNPQTYNEKIQWLKIYDRDPIKTLLADKVLVREWVEKKIGKKYLIPVLGVYRNSKEIDFNALPDRFVLKGNHGSAMNAIVKDKKSADLESIRRKANMWMHTNFAFGNGFELHYNDIPRRIIIEKYMENADGDMPDYKFWCFDGKVRFIQLVTGRGGSTHTGLFDTDWKLLPFSTGNHPMFEQEIKPPAALAEMIEISEKLAEGFVHVRVDLYIDGNGEVKFGEMTFTPLSGAIDWDPPEADLYVGKMLHLPENLAEKN